MNKEKVTIPMTTLDFYKYEQDGIIYYEFDARDSSPPEPMVNALHALPIIKDKNKRVVGKFFHEPTPLYAKIADFFDYDAKELEDGTFEIVFKIKEGRE